MLDKSILKQTYEFKLTRGDGEETILKHEFPSGTDIYGVTELFKSFLRAVTFTDCTIEKVFVEFDV